MRARVAPQLRAALYQTQAAERHGQSLIGWLTGPADGVPCNGWLLHESARLRLFHNVQHHLRRLNLSQKHQVFDGIDLLQVVQATRTTEG